MSGDLVSDVPPGAVAAAHRRHGAAVTAMLCSAPVSGPLESGSTSGKDKTKKQGRYNIIGLDSMKQFLLYIATGSICHLFPFSFSLVSPPPSLTSWDDIFWWHLILFTGAEVEKDIRVQKSISHAVGQVKD